MNKVENLFFKLEARDANPSSNCVLRRMYHLPTNVRIKNPESALDKDLIARAEEKRSKRLARNRRNNK